LRALRFAGLKGRQNLIAVSNGDLNTVWGNEAGDPSFGVTSAITLSDLNANIATPRMCFPERP
jgi:hypothetical protein